MYIEALATVSQCPFRQMFTMTVSVQCSCRAFFAVILFLLNLSPAIAQIPHQSSFRFDHFSIEQGLSQSSGHCILQDRRGFIWIGTQDGVNRYDGYTFTVFRHKPADTTSLSDSWITNLYEDRTGQLWITTRNGLNLFDAARERFTRLRVPLVTAMCSDTAQNVYIATIQGVYRYAHRSRQTTLLTNLASPAIALDSAQNLIIATEQGLMRVARNATITERITLSESIFQSTPIYAVQTRADGTILAMTKGRAARIDAVSGKILETIALNSAHTPQNAAQSVFSIHALSDGNVWFGSGAAVTFWNLQAHEARTFTAPPQTLTSSAQELINCCSLENDATLWVGTNLGAWIVSLASPSAKRIEPDPTDADALNDPQILSICHDRFGTLWLGTRTGGVNTWNPRRYKFALVRHNPFNSNSLSNDGVRGFLEDKDGLWVATDKGLNFFDSAKKTWTRFLPTVGNPRTIAHEHVTYLVDDGRGTLWCGSRFGGISAFSKNAGNKQTRTFRQFRANTADSTALAHDNVFAMCLSKQGATRGQIWVATQGGGLHLLNPESGKFRRFQRQNFGATGFATDSVRSVFEDKQGRVWVGTSGYGLWLFSPEKGVIARFANNVADTTSLSNNTVTNMCEDSRGRLWVATASGLNRFIPETQAFERFSAENGLPNAYVYGICEDAMRNLWLSTNNGLCAFNPDKHTFRNFDVFDGLQSNEFNTGAFYASPSSGRLYFGGVRGYNYFNPAEVLAYTPSELPIVMIAFNVNDVQRAFTQPLAEVREISLDYNENKISFEFVALDFLGAEKIRYGYLLEGFDVKWSDWGARRYAAYTNLEAGTYHFRVRASGAGGFGEQGESASIVIRIRPPFWATWWFRVLAVIAAVSSLYAGFLWRVRNIKRQNEILEEQVQHRTEQLTQANDEIQRQNTQLHDQNIAMELAIQELAALNKEKNEFLGIAAHDLKNPLTGIMLSANMITAYRHKLTENDLTDAVKKIYLSAERMFSIITNLLDINAIESGKFNFTPTTLRMNALVEGVVEDYRARAEAKQITLIVETMLIGSTSPNTAPILAFADNTATTEILENLVSNAVKYSPLGKRVWVRVVAGLPNEIAAELRRHNIPLTHDIPEGCIIACVQDEGTGIPQNEKSRLFGRFVKLSTRPTAGEHSTGLGLSIVKKMTEAMNGKVWCESEEGNGAAFVLALPKAEI